MALPDILVLCGGLGTRLKSVTGETPKVLAEINGEPFLDFLIRYLKNQGASRIILCAGYKAESLIENYQEKFNDIDLQFSIEPEPLGTGGAFKHAQSLVKSDSFFGLNGDCFTPINYKQAYDFFKNNNAIASLTLAKVDDASDYGTVDTDEENSVLAFKEKQGIKEEAYINAGIYCCNSEVLDQMPEGKFSIEYDFFPKLIGQQFLGHKVDAPFIDIGTPERFAWAQNYLNDMIK